MCNGIIEPVSEGASYLQKTIITMKEPILCMVWIVFSSNFFFPERLVLAVLVKLKFKALFVGRPELIGPLVK